MPMFSQMSESEMQVMEILWSSDGKATSAWVIEQLSAKKEWKPSTVWTFLGRLADKGFIHAEKAGKRSYYSPAMTREEYRGAQTKEFLQSVHGGSVKSFFAALSGGQELGEAELNELRSWLLDETEGAK